jgi:outer membrane protein TolC
MICVAGARAQNVPIEQLILKPVGPPTKPVGRKRFAESLHPSSTLPNLPIMPGQLRITQTITFKEFMRRVETSNLGLAAQRYNVPIAQAELVAARVYPDPSVQIGYGGDVSNNRQVTTYAGSVSQEIVLGGKIGDRQRVADAALRGSEASLEDYLRTLRGQAANAFIDGMIGVLRLQREEKTLQRARQLVELNTERLKKGEISEDGVMRARISELEAISNSYDSESDLHQTLGGLAVMMGVQLTNGLIVPVGNAEQPPRNFDLQTLVDHATAERSDVIAAQYALEQARANYRLTQANRIPDLTLSGLYNHLTRVTNPIDPSPAWDSAAVSISVPIPLSNFNHGALDTAYYQVQQGQANLQAAKLQAATDVRTAYEHYRLAVAGTDQFASEILRDADSVYKARLFKLQAGTTSLTDVLDAHQALDELYFDYYNSLSREAKALVEVEQAAGIWDIDF